MNQNSNEAGKLLQDGDLVLATKTTNAQFEQVIGTVPGNAKNGRVSIRLLHVLRKWGNDGHGRADAGFVQAIVAGTMNYTDALVEDVEKIDTVRHGQLLCSTERKMTTNDNLFAPWGDVAQGLQRKLDAQQQGKMREAQDERVVIIVDNGVVQDVLTSNGSIRCLVLDREDPAGADYVNVAGGSAALDAMAQALPRVQRARVKRAFAAVERSLAQSRFAGNEDAQRILSSVRSPQIKNETRKLPGQPARSELENVLIQAIEASGFLVSGPSDSRAAEHGEPAWVCNGRSALAACAQRRLPHVTSVDVMIPGLAPEFASEHTYTAAMHVSRLEQAIKAWHVADETYEDVASGPLSAEHAVVCMLADYRHYCDAKGLDFAKLDRNAYSDYREHLANDRHFGVDK